MGGFLSPSPPPPPAPEPEPATDPDAEDRKRRLDAIDRRRRGRAGTIATSERGVTRPLSAPVADDGLKDKLGD